MCAAVNVQVLCRLCAGPADRGSHLFAGNRPLASIVNTYLPLKVCDDGKYPNTICPGCNIQLEATAQFLDLVIKGQKKLADLKNKQNKIINENLNSPSEDGDIIVQVLEDGSIYAKDHTISLRIEENNAPKRKRGRPSKKDKISIPTVEETVISEPQNEIIVPQIEEESIENNGRRKRIAPKRFGESIHGKELEKVFIEEGFITESNILKLNRKNNTDQKKKPEVIGYLENMDGVNIEELVFDKRKPRGPLVPKTCGECSIKFTSSSSYMAHIATYHSNLNIQENQEPNMENVLISIQENEQDPSIYLNVQENVINPNSQDTMMQINASDVLQDDNVFFLTGPSMPDIASEMTNPDSNSKNNSVIDVANILSETHNRDAKIMEIIADLQMNTEVSNQPELKQTECNLNITEKNKNSKLLKYECTKCLKTYTSKQSCEVHIKNEHQGERPFKCPHCELSFGYKISLKRHILMHKNQSQGFACDICGKVLNHPSSILYHKQTVHNTDQRFVCNKCGKAFRHRQLLLKHQLVHKEDRPYACKFCTSCFKTKACLNNHQFTHTGIKRFMCDICNLRFTHRSNLELHKRCHTGLKPYTCTVCSKTFTQTGNLVEHMRIHTGEKPYSCTICQRAFTTSSQYKCHLKNHKSQKDGKWKCDECDKTYTKKISFNYHMRLHRGEKPFECDICNHKFVEKWALLKHQRLHNGEKPYACKLCDKKFSDSSNLSKHKKMHRDMEKNQLKNDAELTALDTIDNTILGGENRVFCVTFDGHNTEQPNTFHIVNESEIATLNACEFYENEADLLVTDNNTAVTDSVVTESEIQNSNTIFDHFVDEEGNPIQFMIQDGTQFTVTSTDGKLLQIQNDEYILNTNMEEITHQSEQLVQSSNEDVLSQYFTIN